AVARRTREIGIRVALGADAAALTRAILGQSLKLVAVGCAIGLLGAYCASRALTTLVYSVSPTDPVALGGAVVLLAVVALAASAVPMRRALSIDPTQTLRAE
ncbi:MAG TPA: FtsX-like permease family protein, partial [Gemmatimonadaceae bacterium]